MLDIYLDKLYRYPRIQECVSVAVPFKKPFITYMLQ